MLREGTIDDVEALVALGRTTAPDNMPTVAAWRHWFLERQPRGRMRAVVAEVDGTIVGSATGGWLWSQERPDLGVLDVQVTPDQRGRGIGEALATAVEEHLDAIGMRIVRAESLDLPGAYALARRHGFVEVSAATVSAVDPRTVEPLPVPEGIVVCSFAELDDPRAIYALDMEVVKDVPDEVPETIAFEQWKADYWDGPFVDLDTSMVALVEGEAVAVAMLGTDPGSGRGRNNLAGTRRAWRGRGLATVLKSHGLARAAELGITSVTTRNAERNAPMLAVNARLGYRPLARRIGWARDLTSAP